MNRDTVKGTMKKVSGAAESAYGKATGNKSAEMKGEMKKAAGNAQKTMGKAEDAID